MSASPSKPARLSSDYYFLNLIFPLDLLVFLFTHVIILWGTVSGLKTSCKSECPTLSSPLVLVMILGWQSSSSGLRRRGVLPLAVSLAAPCPLTWGGASRTLIWRSWTLESSACLWMKRTLSRKTQSFPTFHILSISLRFLPVVMLIFWDYAFLVFYFLSIIVGKCQSRSW